MRIVECLSHAGFDPNDYSPCYHLHEIYTALQYASENCRVQLARILIRTGADINFIPHSSSPNDSALHSAVDRASIEIVRLLIEVGTR